MPHTPLGLPSRARLAQAIRARRRCDDALGRIAAASLLSDSDRTLDSPLRFAAGLNSRPGPRGVGSHAGNAYLRFDGIVVDRHAATPPGRARPRLRRLFAPRSSRIPRVLLENPERPWTLAALAAEAGLSARTAHLVVNALQEKALIDKRRAAITLTKPGELLDFWAEHYRLDVHQRHTFTFIRDPLEVARQLAGHAAAHRESTALTLHSGAALVAPFVRSPDVHAYFAGDLERLRGALDLRPVESGGTVHLFEPYDAGVFYRVQMLDQVPVVCTTQLYLDLLHYPARGREQAEVLRRQTLTF